MSHVSLYISFYKINCFFAVPVSGSRSPERPTKPQRLVRFALCAAVNDNNYFLHLATDYEFGDKEFFVRLQIYDKN